MFDGGTLEMVRLSENQLSVLAELGTSQLALIVM